MRKIFYLLLTIALSLEIAACFPVLVAGAGAGGYYVGKDDRSVGVIADDAAITAKIKSIYVLDDHIKALDINVDTYEGVVTLYGSVPRSSVEDRAVDIAKNASGVKRVVSKITVVD